MGFALPPSLPGILLDLFAAAAAAKQRGEDRTRLSSRCATNEDGGRRGKWTSMPAIAMHTAA
jgi:hypothetical protein